MFRFKEDIKYMTGRYPPIIFVIMWRFISPVALLVILVISLYKMMVKTPKYEIWNKDLVCHYSHFHLHLSFFNNFS